MLTLYDPYKCPRCHRIYCECGVEAGAIVSLVVLVVVGVVAHVVYSLWM